MIRKTSKVGVLLMALMALGAGSAPRAFAQFEGGVSVEWEAVSNSTQKFAPSEGATTFECTNITFTAPSTYNLPAETIALEPHYSNCENFLGAKTTVDMNGCTYVFKLEKNKTSGNTDIECPEGGIAFTVGTICKYELGTQTGVGSIKYENTGSGSSRSIDLTFNSTGLTVARTTNDLLCPSAGSTGTYTGTINLKGTVTLSNVYVD